MPVNHRKVCDNTNGEVKWLGQTYPLTISIGVAGFPAAAATAAELIAAADAAISVTKETGRNRICLHSETASGPAPPDKKQDSHSETA